MEETFDGDVFTLTDETGKESEFELIGTCEFEGKTYKTMIGYRDYLERTYGDYMTLPPVEQRVTHNFEAYWK